MRVVLKKEVPGLGRSGDIKDVAEGYAQNYLLPRGLATEATSGELKRVAQLRETAKARKGREHAEAEVLAARLGSLSLSFKLKVGPQGKAFGSVTQRDIAEALGAKGIEVTHEKIQLDEPLRSIGPHEVEVRLASGVRARLKLNVEAAA